MWSHSFYKKTFFLHLVYNISQTHLDEQRHSVQGNELSYCGSPIAGKVFYTTLKMYLATFFFDHEVLHSIPADNIFYSSLNILKKCTQYSLNPYLHF